MAELNFKDYRGVRDIVYALLTADTLADITYGAVTPFAGAEEISQEVEESSGTKYYDNAPRIVTTGEGADTWNLITSAIENQVRADIEGRVFDTEKGMYVGTPLNRPYLAIGFVGQLTDGTEEAVWVLKNKITGGNPTHRTTDDGTDSNGLEFAVNSIYTTHKFASADNKPAKFVKVDLSKVDETTFFSKVTTPDEVALKTA